MIMIIMIHHHNNNKDNNKNNNDNDNNNDNNNNDDDDDDDVNDNNNDDNNNNGDNNDDDKNNNTGRLKIMILVLPCTSRFERCSRKKTGFCKTHILMTYFMYLGRSLADNRNMFLIGIYLWGKMRGAEDAAEKDWVSYL